jgi:hypothetical protein
MGLLAIFVNDNGMTADLVINTFRMGFVCRRQAPRMVQGTRKSPIGMLLHGLKSAHFSDYTSLDRTTQL